MDIEIIKKKLNNNEILFNEFKENLWNSLDNFEMEFKRELPENLTYSIWLINKTLEYFSDKENFESLTPNNLINAQRQLISQMQFLIEALSYYSVKSSLYMVYRRNIKSYLSISLRNTAKNFQDTLDKKLTKWDVEDLTSLSTIKETIQEAYYNYISEYLQNLSKNVDRAIRVINNRLYELKKDEVNYDKWTWEYYK